MNDRDSGTVDVRDAEAQLPDLIERVENGEEVVLGRSGKPAARLTPASADFDLDSFGESEGEIWTDPDLGPVEPLLFAAHGGPGVC